MQQHVLSPLPLSSGHVLKNRFALAPMTNHQSAEDGEVTEEEMKWLRMRDEGGFGLVMTCAAHVSAHGQGFPRQLGVYDDQLKDGLKRLAGELEYSLSVVQLHHGGIRSPKALIGRQPLGPSDHEETGSRAMTHDEVKAVVEDFVNAAVRVEQCGFGGIEIHGAHGYLLAQFMSEELNLREDEYGGSYENRTRIVREIIDGIEQSCGAGFSLGLRISAEGNGMSMEDVTRFAQEQMQSGVLDYLDVSLWDCFKEPAEEKYQGRSLLSYFTELDRGKTALGVAGKLMEPENVEAVIEQGADFVLLGKAGILQHDFPNRYAENARFTPHGIPTTAEHLRNEGLSEHFINYMRGWEGFVEMVTGE